jgi:hypothetical protein
MSPTAAALVPRRPDLTHRRVERSPETHSAVHEDYAWGEDCDVADKSTGGAGRSRRWRLVSPVNGDCKGQNICARDRYLGTSCEGRG